MFQAPRHVTDAVCSSFMGGVNGQALTERDPPCLSGRKCALPLTHHARLRIPCAYRCGVYGGRKASLFLEKVFPLIQPAEQMNAANKD